MQDDERLLTPDEVCVLLAVTKSWLYDQVAARRIPVQKLPGSKFLRFRRSEIVAMLEANHVPAEEQPDQEIDRTVKVLEAAYRPVDPMDYLPPRLQRRRLVT